LTREQANKLTDALYEGGFDVIQEILHPPEHPNSVIPWVTVRVAALTYKQGDLLKIVEMIAANGGQDLTFSVHDGIVIR
jgi:hypothetical protein